MQIGPKFIVKYSNFLLIVIKLFIVICIKVFIDLSFSFEYNNVVVSCQNGLEMG